LLIYSHFEYNASNYILAEGLYRARIDPFADLHEINTDQRKMLFQELRDVALTSYAAQGLTRPQGGTYRNVDGNRGEFEFQLQCYGQSVSPAGNPVVREVNGPHGRTIWVSRYAACVFKHFYSSRLY
jgi:NADH:ubiquinone oxidoreductase subunit D